MGFPPAPIALDVIALIAEGRPRPACFAPTWVLQPVSAENAVTVCEQHLPGGRPRHHRPDESQHERPAMALGLVYMMLVRLLGWLALLPAPTPPI
jgi:hypothetical protein